MENGNCVACGTNIFYDHPHIEIQLDTKGLCNTCSPYMSCTNCGTFTKHLKDTNGYGKIERCANCER